MQPQQRKNRGPVPQAPNTNPRKEPRSLWVKKNYYYASMLAKSWPTETITSDLLFIHDCTASQGPYISGTVKRCLEIIEVIQGLGKTKTDKGIRFGLIAFRDHYPEEEFLIRDFGRFTHDIEKIVENLRSLEADGGGDYPEAVTAALAHGLTLDWRDGGAKLVVLITDAAPHGIGEAGDDFEEGDPNGMYIFHLKLDKLYIFATRTWPSHASKGDGNSRNHDGVQTPLVNISFSLSNVINSWL